MFQIPKKLFRLTGFSAKESKRIVEDLDSLGAIVLNDLDLLKPCTLVCGYHLTASDKFLLACCTGEWIVTYKYVEACLKANRLLSERQFEVSALLENSSIQGKDLSNFIESAQFWREKVTKKGYRPFSTWRAVVKVDDYQKRKSIKRLLTAGGCELVDDSCLSCKDRKVYVFVDKQYSCHSVSHLINIQKSSNHKVLSYTYAYQFLITSGRVDWRQFCVPELREQTVNTRSLDKISSLDLTWIQLQTNHFSDCCTEVCKSDTLPKCDKNDDTASINHIVFTEILNKKKTDKESYIKSCDIEDSSETVSASSSSTAHGVKSEWEILASKSRNLIIKVKRIEDSTDEMEREGIVFRGFGKRRKSSELNEQSKVCPLSQPVKHAKKEMSGGLNRKPLGQFNCSSTGNGSQANNTPSNWSVRSEDSNSSYDSIENDSGLLSNRNENGRGVRGKTNGSKANGVKEDGGDKVTSKVLTEPGHLKTRNISEYLFSPVSQKRKSPSDVVNGDEVLSENNNNLQKIDYDNEGNTCIPVGKRHKSNEGVVTDPHINDSAACSSTQVKDSVLDFAETPKRCRRTKSVLRRCHNIAVDNEMSSDDVKIPEAAVKKLNSVSLGIVPGVSLSHRDEQSITSQSTVALPQSASLLSTVTSTVSVNSGSDIETRLLLSEDCAQATETTMCEDVIFIEKTQVPCAINGYTIHDANLICNSEMCIIASNGLCDVKSDEIKTQSRVQNSNAMNSISDSARDCAATVSEADLPDRMSEVRVSVIVESNTDTVACYSKPDMIDCNIPASVGTVKSDSTNRYQIEIEPISDDESSNLNSVDLTAEQEVIIYQVVDGLATAAEMVSNSAKTSDSEGVQKSASLNIRATRRVSPSRRSATDPEICEPEISAPSDQTNPLNLDRIRDSFETYYTELLELWLRENRNTNANHILSNLVSSDFRPTPTMLSYLVQRLQKRDESLESSHEQLSATVVSLVQSNPPHYSSLSSAHYVKSILQIKVNSAYAESPCDVLLSLIKKLSTVDEKTKDSIRTDQQLLNYIIDVISANFNSYKNSRISAESADEDTSTRSQRCMYSDWFWPGGYVHSRNFNLLLTSLITVSQQPDQLSLMREIERVMRMLLEWSMLTNNRTNLSDLTLPLPQHTLSVCRVIATRLHDAGLSADQLLFVLDSLTVDIMHVTIVLHLLLHLVDFSDNENLIYVNSLSLFCIVKSFFRLPADKFVVRHGNDTARTPKKNLNSASNQHVSPIKDVNKRDKKGETCVHVACRGNRVEKLKEMLQCQGVNVNSADNMGWTPLHEAVNHGSVQCVELLLQFKPKRNILSYFSPGKHDSGSLDLSAANNEGITALHEAIQQERCQIITLLLQYGGKVLLTNKNSSGKTPEDFIQSDSVRQVVSQGLELYEQRKLNQPGTSSQAKNLLRPRIRSLNSTALPQAGISSEDSNGSRQPVIRSASSQEQSTESVDLPSNDELYRYLVLVVRLTFLYLKTSKSRLSSLEGEMSILKDFDEHVDDLENHLSTEFKVSTSDSRWQALFMKLRLLPDLV